MARADFDLNALFFNTKAFFVSACQHFHFFNPALGRVENQPWTRPKAGFQKMNFFEKQNKKVFQRFL